MLLIKVMDFIDNLYIDLINDLSSIHRLLNHVYTHSFKVVSSSKMFKTVLHKLRSMWFYKT